MSNKFYIQSKLTRQIVGKKINYVIDIFEEGNALLASPIESTGKAEASDQLWTFEPCADYTGYFFVKNASRPNPAIEIVKVGTTSPTYELYANPISQYYINQVWIAKPSSVQGYFFIESRYEIENSRRQARPLVIEIPEQQINVESILLYADARESSHTDNQLWELKTFPGNSFNNARYNIGNDLPFGDPLANPIVTITGSGFFPVSNVTISFTYQTDFTPVFDPGNPTLTTQGTQTVIVNLDGTFTTVLSVPECLAGAAGILYITSVIDSNPIVAPPAATMWLWQQGDFTFQP
jgi:hypothetical protein